MNKISILLATLLVIANADEMIVENRDEIIEAKAEVMEFEETELRICLDCRCLPLAKTEPLEPCVEAKPEVKTVYKDRIIYEKEIVFKERQAPKKNHISLGVTHSESKVEEMDTVSKIGATIGVGYDLNKYVGVELRMGETFSNKKNIQQLDAFIKPMLPIGRIGSNLNLYGLIGYAETDVVSEKIRTTIRGPLAGFGIEVGNFFIDFTTQDIKESNSNVVSAGVTYDF